MLKCHGSHARYREGDSSGQAEDVRGVALVYGVEVAAGVVLDGEPVPPGVGVGIVTVPTLSAQTLLIVGGFGWFSIDTTAPTASKLTVA